MRSAGAGRIALIAANRRFSARQLSSTPSSITRIKLPFSSQKLLWCSWREESCNTTSISVTSAIATPPCTNEAAKVSFRLLFNRAGWVAVGGDHHFAVAGAERMQDAIAEAEQHQRQPGLLRRSLHLL